MKRTGVHAHLEGEPSSQEERPWKKPVWNQGQLRTECGVRKGLYKLEMLERRPTRMSKTMLW